MLEESLAREVSRLWWGALVDPVTFHEEWLMRGLTDFSGSVSECLTCRPNPIPNDFLEHWRLARERLLAKPDRRARRTR